jgi:predicted Zn-dependent protease
LSRTLELAERAVAEAPAEAGIALVTRERSLMLRFARSRPTQATSVDDVTVEIAIVRDGHVGRAATNDPTGEALAACGRRADAAASAAARADGSGSYPGVPGPGEPGSVEPADPETARLDPAAGGRALAAVFAAAAAAGVEAHGIWTAGEVETAVVCTSGTSVSESVTDAFMKVICMAPSGRSGYAARTARGVGRLEPAELAERAATKATRRGEPAAVEPGDHPVVLEHHAVADLLDLLAFTAFDGLAYAEERGALAGRLGSMVASPAVNLADSPRLPATLARSFDAEGVPKAPLPLIQDGVAHRVVHDTRSAAMAGVESTGHARAPGGGPAPIPTNLVLAGGGAADAAELCAPIERGVYVTRLWYGNVARPKETLVTAVSRDGTFLIEDGHVTRPLGDVRLTDSVLGILSRTQALTARPVLTSAGEFYGRRFASGIVCPAIRADGVRLAVS